MMQKFADLTLIETILLMTMVAIVGIVTVPQFVAAAEEVRANAKWEISVTAKNARSALTEQTGNTPTVIALAEQLSDANGKAIASGIQVQFDGDTHIIPTYTNSLCNEPTLKVNDQVGCVGAIQ